MSGFYRQKLSVASGGAVHGADVEIQGISRLQRIGKHVCVYVYVYVSHIHRYMYICIFLFHPLRKADAAEGETRLWIKKCKERWQRDILNTMLERWGDIFLAIQLQDLLRSRRE